MVSLSRSRLATGVIVCLLLAVLMHAAKLWAPGGPFSEVIQVLLGVGFWFILVVGAVLLVGAIDWWPAGAAGAVRGARGGLLLGGGLALGAVFVAALTIRWWLIYTSPEPTSVELTPAGFLSFTFDALFGLVEATAGILMALGCLVLLSRKDRHDKVVDPAQDPASELNG